MKILLKTLAISVVSVFRPASEFTLVTESLQLGFISGVFYIVPFHFHFIRISFTMITKMHCFCYCNYYFL